MPARMDDQIVGRYDFVVFVNAVVVIGDGE